MHTNYLQETLHVLQLQLSPFRDLIRILNEILDWLDYISTDVEFQRIMPLKAIEFNPFRTVLALGSCQIPT